MNERHAMMLMVCATLTTAAVVARTVVLWPMAEDAVSGSSGVLLNAAASGDNLTLVNAVAAPLETDWNLPANLENIGLIGAREIVGNAYRRQAYSDTAGRWLTHVRNFTVEAFVKIDELPAVSGQGTFFQALTNDVGVTQFLWAMSLRHARNINADKTTADVTLEMSIGNDDRLMSTLTDLESLTNSWHHLAVTHSYDAEKNQAAFRLYWDGELQGAGYDYKPNDVMKATPEAASIDLMTRNNGWYGQKMRMCFFRISDVVLGTDSFMSETGARMLLSPSNKTVAYWKLGRDASGDVDGADSVGDARMNGGLIQLPGARAASPKPTMIPVPDCAFAGNPPNQTAALPAGNAGSWRSIDDDSAVFCQGIGPKLSLTSAFTVEGYLKPVRTAHDASVVGHVFQNADGAAKWSLDFGNPDRTGWRFWISASDADGVLASAPVSADLSTWSDDFKHIAIVYEPVGGISGGGTWSCYVDGALAGSAKNSRSCSSSFADAVFALGGGADGFLGCYDCVRICTTALDVPSFLCAENGSAATELLAYWPLNRLPGEQPDGRDVAAGGNYHIQDLNESLLQASLDGQPYCVTTTTGESNPIVTNPDQSPAFKGNSAQTDGCARFWTKAKDRAYLLTTDRSVLNTFSSTEGYTVEGYFRRSSAVTSSFQVLFALQKEFAVTNASTHKMRLCEKPEGLVIMSRGAYASFKDVSCGYAADELVFPDTKDILTVDEWHHVALVVENSGTHLTYRLFVDRVECGTGFRAKIGNEFSSASSVAFVLGGNTYDDREYKGEMSSLRVSRGALLTSEFLSAEASQPVSEMVRPIACWPLDVQQGVLSGNSLLGGAALTQSEAWSAAEQQRARAYVLSPWLDETVWPKTANVGSAECQRSGKMSSVLLGTAFELTKAFTIEGWLKEVGNEGSVGRVVGVSCAERECGWELRLDKTGTTPRLRVLAYDGNSQPIVDDAFEYDASALADDWTHLGLVYAPPSALNGGLGEWRLFVNGKAVGSLLNRRNPAGMTIGLVGHSEFSLGGGESNVCKGMYDIWRATEGALSSEQLMYSARVGLLLLLR